jgi:hypothetical protein
MWCRIGCVCIGFNIGGCNLVGCNALFDIHDPELETLGGRGGAAGMGTTDCAGAGGCDIVACGASEGCGSTVTLEGRALAYDTGSPVPGVNVSSSLSNPMSVTSAADGSFALRGIPAATGLDLVLTDASSDASIRAFKDTVLSIDDLGSEPSRSVSLPVVSHAWLIQVAKECGVLGEAATPDESNRYFNGRSTLLVELVDPQPGLTRNQIDVLVDRTRSNVDTVPTSSDMYPTQVCFLDSDSPGSVRGTRGTEATDFGGVIVFRVQNASGTGVGEAVVNVMGQPSSSVRLSSAGQTGVVKIGGAW